MDMSSWCPKLLTFCEDLWNSIWPWITDCWPWDHGKQLNLITFLCFMFLFEVLSISGLWSFSIWKQSGTIWDWYDWKSMKHIGDIYEAPRPTKYHFYDYMRKKMKHVGKLWGDIMQFGNQFVYFSFWLFTFSFLCDCASLVLVAPHYMRRLRFFHVIRSNFLRSTSYD